MKNVFIIFRFIFIQLISVSAKDYYCSETSEGKNIQGQRSGVLITYKEGKSYYSNNQLCVWTIQAKADERIQLIVESSVLQWSPPRSLCTTYDHVDVRDENGTVATWCGEEYPRELSSKNSWLKIVFQSDGSNPRGHVYRGARIRFRIFNKSSCPPDWLAFEGFCYRSTKAKHEWDLSQRSCNQMQSNLLTIKSFEEWHFLSHSSGLLKEPMWTGLNDITNPTNLKWIDNSPFIAFDNKPKVDEFRHCGAIDIKTGIYMALCDTAHLAICKANKTTETKLFSVPVQDKDKNKDGGEAVSPRVLLLAIGIPFAVLILIILCLFRGRLGKLCEKKEQISQDHDQQIEEIDRLRERPTAPPVSMSTYVEPPPSYDELFEK